MKQTVVIAAGLLLLAFFSQPACSKNHATEAVVITRPDTTTNPVDTTSTPKDTTQTKDSTVTNTYVQRRYLALGDSYTIGESVLINERYAKQLADSMYKYKIAVYDLNIIARTGWTTYNLLNALQSTPPTGTYDLVTLLIGVNNQYQGLSLSQYSTEFKSLIEKCKQYAGFDASKIIVISIPDYSVVPFAYYSDTAKIRRELQEFNKVNKDITTQQGIKYVDVFALSQEARYNKTLVARDSLHFSGKEYTKWTNLLIPLAKEILK